jgi:Putative prokaryotic signal transducing protein
MELVTLATFPSDFEATLAKNILETNGVRATLAGGGYPILPEGLPYGTRLVVAEEDRQRAAAILNEARLEPESDSQCAESSQREPPNGENVQARPQGTRLALALFIVGFLLLALWALIWAGAPK